MPQSVTHPSRSRWPRLLGGRSKSDSSIRPIQEQLGATMLDQLTINVMLADRNRVIRYMNRASLATLKSMQQVLPVPAEQIVGMSIDDFHRNPSHQRDILSDPTNLPRRANIQVGSESLSLCLSALYDTTGDYVGAMATWELVTAHMRLKQDAAEISRSVTMSTEEMAQAIREIANNVNNTSLLASQTNEVFSRMADDVDRLRDTSRGIEDIVQMIQNTASQTNLLALNATIEAARAGDHGKGFAVVASEVKDLAQETGRATSTIQDRVNSILTGIDEIVTATKKVTDLIREVSSNTTGIASAIEEQTILMNQLSEAAASLSEKHGDATLAV